MIMAIDIGRYKVSCAVAKVDKNGFVVIDTAAMMQSSGFENGVVTNQEMAVDTLRRIIQKTRHQSSKTISQVWCTVSGLQVTSAWVQSQTPITNGYVSKHHIHTVIGQCMDEMKHDNLDNNRDFLHIVPHTYMVDKVATKHPFKMAGKILLAHVLVCRGDATVLKNIESVFEDCNTKLTCIAVDGYMSGLAVLEQQELDLDYAMCLDMGDSTTAASLFYQGALVWCKNFDFGAGYITERIMNTTTMNRQTADSLKKRATVVLDDLPHADAHRPLVYDRMGEQDTQYHITLREISTAMVSEYTKAFKMIKDTIPANFGHIRRVVLTGGGSQTNGISRLAAEVMDAHVRIGSPHNVVLNGSQKHMISAALIGLIKYSQTHLSLDSQAYIRTHNMEYTGSLLSRLSQWFRDNI